MPLTSGQDLLTQRVLNLFRLHDEQAAEVRRIKQEIAEGGPNWLWESLEDAEGALREIETEFSGAKRLLEERRNRTWSALEERYASAVAEPYIEGEVFESEMDWQSKEAGVRRGEAAAEGRAARSGRLSLDDLLQSEGIPREGFLDFMEIPENRRSGKSIPQLIEDYKIAGELPGSAGMPASRPTSSIVSPTSDQKAFSALDPEGGLNVFTPTDVEAEWTGSPQMLADEILDDEDVLARAIAPKKDLLEGATLGMDPETGDFRPITPSGERQMIVGGSNIPERQMVVPGGNVPESYWIESAADALNLEPGQVRQDIRSQADFYKGLLRENKTPAIAFDDPIMRAAYEIAEAEVAAERRTASPRPGRSARGAASVPADSEFARINRPFLDAARTSGGRAAAEAEAKRLLDLLKDPNIEARIGPEGFSQLKTKASGLSAALDALGSYALAGELGYFIGYEGDVGRGLMAQGAANIEGTGALLQLPQQAMEQIPGYGEVGVHPGAEGLAWAGRKISRLAEPYRRMKDREAYWAFEARNVPERMRMNPALTEAEAKTLVRNEWNTLQAAPPGGYPQQIPTGTQQRALLDAGYDPLTRTWGNVPTPEPVSQREAEKQRYMNWLVDQGYMKWGTGKYEGALLQDTRAREEGSYPTMSDWETERSLAGGM
tara:strand:+ start:5613 stop:7601 length:1989 start_codon:yes stop_codon:yes gene_type:complete